MFTTYSPRIFVSLALSVLLCSSLLAQTDGVDRKAEVPGAKASEPTGSGSGTPTAVATGAAAAVVPPKFSAMRVKMSVAPNEQDDAAGKKQRTDWEKLADVRDAAMKKALAVSPSGKSIAGTELASLTDAQRSVMNICNAGFDHIERRMNANAKTSAWVGLATALLGVSGGAAGTLGKSKFLTLSSAGVSAFKSDFLPSADSDHSTTSLKSVADDVRLELAAATTDFSRWMFAPEPDKVAQATKLQHLQAALVATSHACSFF